MSTWTINPDTPVDELWSRWITETTNERDPETNNLYLMTYGATHIAPFFKTLGAITSARAADYMRHRLGSVLKTTVNKELSALRGFLAWCQEQGYVDAAPVIPKPARRATGTRFGVRRRGKSTELGVEECRLLINCLPEWSESLRVSRFPIRARFVVAFETSLRPATLNALSVPEHYTRGATSLTITEDIDKARFSREVPLSPEACAALDSILPDHGLIFGDHDYRDQLRAAAAAVLTPAKAKTFTAYDLRSARLTQLAETNLNGAAFVAGHTRISTTAIYVRPNQAAARRALSGAGPTGFTPPGQKPAPYPASARERLAGVGNSPIRMPLCEGEDLNLHGNNPASTSS